MIPRGAVDVNRKERKEHKDKSMLLKGVGYQFTHCGRT